MYQLNLLNRKTLIVPKEVIFHAPVGHTIDERNYWNNIIIAENRFLAPLLGYPFYEALCNEKNTVVTSGNKATLLAAIQAYETSIGVDPLNTTNDLTVGDIVNAAENITTTTYKTLWNDYLWKYLAECVECVAIVPTWLQHTSQGQQKNNPQALSMNGQSSASGELKDIQFKEKKFIEDRIDPLRAGIEYYLCANSTSFPLYTCADSTTADGVSLSRKSPIIHNVYEDEEGGCEW